jgi:hypothetical protein
LIGGKKPPHPVKTGNTAATATATHSCTLPFRVITSKPLVPISAAVVA